MASPSKPAYIKVTVGCTNCQAKQVVNVPVHAELVPSGGQIMVCAECGQGFEVKVPNHRAQGPFPA